MLYAKATNVRRLLVDYVIHINQYMPTVNKDTNTPAPRRKRKGPKTVASRKLASSKTARAKVRKVMHEYKEGELHSGSRRGPKVASRRQAVAIALSEAGVSKKKSQKK